jgi:hypothetical protein
LSPEQAAALLKDSLRVLKPGGIVRAVVPDLETLARGYLEAVEEVRGRRSEVGGQRTEDGGRKTEDLGETEDGGRRAEDGGRRAEDGGRRTEDSKNSPQRAQRDSEDPDTFEDKPSTFNLQPSTLLERYDWSVIFLIDQLCRTDTGGRMLARLAEYGSEPPAFLRKCFNSEWLECVLGERSACGARSDVRCQMSGGEGPSDLRPRNSDLGPQTSDLLGKAESGKRKAEIETTSNAKNPTSNIQQSDNQEPRAKNQEPSFPGLQSVVCSLQSDPNGLQTTVFSLQSVIRRITPGLRWRWRVVMQALERVLRKHCPGMADRLDCWRTARYLAQGERHQWMYDEVSMKRLMEDCGFVNVQRMTAGSTLSPFEDDLRRLDMTASGETYQPMSLYVEGCRGKVAGSRLQVECLRGRLQVTGGRFKGEG